MRTLFKFWSTTRIGYQVMGHWWWGERGNRGDLEAALGSFTKSGNRSASGARCSRLDWTSHCMLFDQRGNLINQNRSQQRCKLKKEQASKVKQIELDLSKQKLIYEKRQEKTNDKLRRRTAPNKQKIHCECFQLPQVDEILHAGHFLIT